MTAYKQCDGMTRRDLIKVGMLGSAGLTMSGLDRLASADKISAKATAKSAIFIELPGGPSHIDTFDLKPDAAVEYRGLFNPIKTNVPGMEICEHLPKLAKQADKFAIIRGVSHTLGAHPLGQEFIFTGNRPNPSVKYPGFGSVAAKELPAEVDLPTYVAVPKNQAGAGHLGVNYAPLITNEVPRKGKPFNVRGITLSGGVQIELIAQNNDVPSMYRELSDTYGFGVQHICFYPPDYDAALAHAFAAGCTMGQEGSLGGIRFAYVRSPDGAVLEFGDLPEAVHQQRTRHIERAAAWDGTDPIRVR